MHIVVHHHEPEYLQVLVTYADGTAVSIFLNGAAPDALSEAMNGLAEIPAIAREAWEAGKRGEAFLLDQIDDREVPSC